VEFALILPIIMFLLLGMVEMGFAINHNTSIVTATRQGARVGSQLVDGGDRKGLSGVTTASQAVDPQIIAAVEGILVSPGSPVSVQQVTQIDIYEVDENGVAVVGHTNPWISSVNIADGTGTGPPIPGGGGLLHFKASGTGGWDASVRSGGAPAHGIGVRITYTYKFLTPLGSLLSIFGTLFGTQQITMTDTTIMALEPPSP
jgi:hypothetical protein